MMNYANENYFLTPAHPGYHSVKIKTTHEVTFNLSKKEINVNTNLCENQYQSLQYIFA